MALRKGHAEIGTSWRFVSTRRSIIQRKFEDKQRKYSRTHYPTLRLDVTNSNLQTWNWTTDSSFSSFPSKMQAHLRFTAVVLYILTPWSRILLVKLTGFQLVKKFPAFYGTRRFIAAFTSASVWIFHNNISFYDDEMLARRPTPKLEDHTFSAVRDCLFNIFTATLLIGGRSSIRNPRTRHAVVRGKERTVQVTVFCIRTPVQEPSASIFSTTKLSAGVGRNTVNGSKR